MTYLSSAAERQQSGQQYVSANHHLGTRRNWWTINWGSPNI